ncbi:MAG: protein kinase [Pyrinomonadaceae bacterium]
MNSNRFKKIESIYHDAADLAGEDRKRLLDKQCAGDAELRREVEALLLAESAEGIVDDSPHDLAASLFTADEKTDLVGHRIGKYSVLSVIGEGGMGKVYLAQDDDLKRNVALKVLPAELVKDSDRIERFIHEARSASALNHPNILTIFEVGETELSGEKIHYISMEYVEGDVLNKFIYEKRSGLPELLNFLCQAGDGLAKAHKAGIAHRDLKPENIMINSDGFAKVLDFGLAKLVNKEAVLHQFQKHRSRSGVILGTVGYMSPEQAKGSPDIDQRSDIFSFGCILYEAVAGKKPFTVESAIDSLHEIIHKDPIPLNEHLPSVPVNLQNIIEKCLAKSPADRFQTIEELISRLRSVAIPAEKITPTNRSQTDFETISVDDATPTRTISEPAFDLRKLVTVVYADISAISELFETFDPEEADQKLNGIWGLITSVVSETGGQISLRSSDAFCAVWGTGVVHESDPETAVRNALILQEKIAKYFKRNLSGEFELEETEEKETFSEGLLRIGVNTGATLIGTESDPLGSKLSGNLVSVAKRLAGEADVGQILAAHDTYRHIRGIFNVEPKTVKHSIRLKGKTIESRVYRIKDVKPRAFRLRARGIEGIETKLIGRKGELDKMMDALDAVSEESELQAITVVGEAGLGKSRLLFEFRDQVELLPGKFRIFNCRATEGTNNLPFSLLKDLFSFRFDINETDSEETGREKFSNGIREMWVNAKTAFSDEELEVKEHFIGNLIGIKYEDSIHLKGAAEDPGQLRDRTLRYAKEFFRSIAQDIPVIFYLDDLHWADHESVDFFQQIISELNDSKILILNFARPVFFENRPRWGEGIENHKRIDLAGLSKRETRILAKNLLQKLDKPPSDLIDMIASNADGNPFYAEELVKMMIDRKIILTKGDNWKLDETRLGKTTVPTLLSGVIQARLDQLSVPERKTLQNAAAVGIEFWADALEDLDPSINHRSVLSALREKEIVFHRESSSLVNSNEYVFKHALFREVTYETISIRQREKLHQKIGDWLAAKSVEIKSENSSVIAEHYENAKNYAKAAYWFGNAGAYAFKTHSPKAAVSFFTRALKLIDLDSERGRNAETELEWKHKLGTSYHILANFDAAIRTYEELLDAAQGIGDIAAQARALIGISHSSLENGNNLAAFDAASNIELLPAAAGNTELEILRSRGLYRKARALYSMGKFDQTIPIGEEILARTLKFGEQAIKVRANSYHILAAANMAKGNFKKAFEYEEKEVELSRQIGDERTLTNGLNSLGEQMRLQGEAAKAISYFEQGLNSARKIGAVNSEIMILSNLGGARILLGEFEAAESVLRKVLEMTKDSGHFILPETYRFLSEALLGQHHRDEALEAGKNALRLSEEAKNQENIGGAWRAIGKVLGTTGGRTTIHDEEVTSADCFATAFEIFEGSGMKSEYARTLRDSAGFTDDKHRRLDMLQRAAEIFDELEMEFEFEKTRQAITKINLEFPDR